MKKCEIIIPAELHNSRIDKALSNCIKNVSRNQLQKIIIKDGVIINNNLIFNASHKVKLNDKILINIDSIINNDTDNLISKNIKIDIIYEDDDIIVINKQHGLTVHPGAGNNDNTLVNGLLFYTKNLSNLLGNTRLGIVHRLDKDTSGLIIIAKNNEAHIRLIHQMKSRLIIRKYKTLIWGVLQPIEGTINSNIGRDPKNRKYMKVLKDNGKFAITHYKTLSIFMNGLFSFVECQLFTGRTHQIRVHFSNLDHPILGDNVYCSNKVIQKYLKEFKSKISITNKQLETIINSIHRQALHAYYLEFFHPKSNKVMQFKCNIPSDINNTIDSIKNTN